MINDILILVPISTKDEQAGKWEVPPLVQIWWKLSIEGKER